MPVPAAPIAAPSVGVKPACVNAANDQAQKSASTGHVFAQRLPAVPPLEPRGRVPAASGYKRTYSEMVSDHVPAGRQNPGNERGKEQFGDVLFGQLIA